MKTAWHVGSAHQKAGLSPKFLFKSYLINGSGSHVSETREHTAFQRLLLLQSLSNILWGLNETKVSSAYGRSNLLFILLQPTKGAFHVPGERRVTQSSHSHLFPTCTGLLHRFINVSLLKSETLRWPSRARCVPRDRECSPYLSHLVVFACLSSKSDLWSRLAPTWGNFWIRPNNPPPPPPPPSFPPCLHPSLRVFLLVQKRRSRTPVCQRAAPLPHPLLRSFTTKHNNLEASLVSSSFSHGDLSVGGTKERDAQSWWTRRGDSAHCRAHLSILRRNASFFFPDDVTSVWHTEPLTCAQSFLWSPEHLFYFTRISYSF